MKKIGIDFGTSFSTVSFLNPATNRPEVIKNEYGEEKTPSVVYFGEDETLIGQAAVKRLLDSHSMPAEERSAVGQRTFRSIKRKFRPESAEALPDGRVLRHTEIVAEILKHLKKTVASYHGFDGDFETTLTCPVLFTKKQREMLKEAAKTAGLGEITVREEPIAAALGYAATGTAEIGRNILIYDLGGGTFDLAFVHRNDDGEFEVPIEPMGDNACAGDDFDMAIYHHWERQLLADSQFGFSFSSLPGRIDPVMLHHCRECKKDLSQSMTTRHSHFFPENNRSKTFELTRQEFEQLIEPLVDRTIQLTQRMLDKISDLDLTVDTFLLIGGSCRVPLVLERLKKLHESGILPVLPARIMQADSAVALGAVFENSINSKRNDKPTIEEENMTKIIHFPSDVDDLQEAINRCPEGGTVIIRSGNHAIYEPIHIYKPIKIAGGTGDPDDVVLFYEGEDIENEALLQIEGDSIEISACTIVGNFLRGIELLYKKDAWESTISQCIIRDSSDGVVNAIGKLTLENCDIYKCRFSGIVVLEGGGTFTDCNIYENFAGVSLQKHGGRRGHKPIVAIFTKCRIYNNEDTGISVNCYSEDEHDKYGFAKGSLFESCQIYDNADNIFDDDYSSVEFINCTDNVGKRVF